MELLLDFKASLVTEKGTPTLLQLAYDAGQFSMIPLLLDNGAPLDMYVLNKIGPEVVPSPIIANARQWFKGPFFVVNRWKAQDMESRGATTLSFKSGGKEVGIHGKW